MNKIDEMGFRELSILQSMKAENRIPLFKPPYLKKPHLLYIRVS